MGYIEINQIRPVQYNKAISSDRMREVNTQYRGTKKVTPLQKHRFRQLWINEEILCSKKILVQTKTGKGTIKHEIAGINCDYCFENCNLAGGKKRLAELSEMIEPTILNLPGYLQAEESRYKIHAEFIRAYIPHMMAKYPLVPPSIWPLLSVIEVINSTLSGLRKTLEIDEPQNGTIFREHSLEGV